MTVGDIIDILEQFPRDQVLEMGILTKEDPELDHLSAHSRYSYLGKAPYNR